MGGLNAHDRVRGEGEIRGVDGGSFGRVRAEKEEAREKTRAGKTSCAPLDFIQRCGESGVAWAFRCRPMAIGRWRRERGSGRGGAGCWASWAARAWRNRSGPLRFGPRGFREFLIDLAF